MQVSHFISSFILSKLSQFSHTTTDIRKNKSLNTSSRHTKRKDSTKSKHKFNPEPSSSKSSAYAPSKEPDSQPSIKSSSSYQKSSGQTVKGKSYFKSIDLREQSKALLDETSDRSRVSRYQVRGGWNFRYDEIDESMDTVDKIRLSHHKSKTNLGSKKVVKSFQVSKNPSLKPQGSNKKVKRTLKGKSSSSKRIKPDVRGNLSMQTRDVNSKVSALQQAIELNQDLKQESQRRSSQTNLPDSLVQKSPKSLNVKVKKHSKRPYSFKQDLGKISMKKTHLSLSNLSITHNPTISKVSHSGTSDIRIQIHSDSMSSVDSYKYLSKTQVPRSLKKKSPGSVKMLHSSQDRSLSKPKMLSKGKKQVQSLTQRSFQEIREGQILSPDGNKSTRIGPQLSNQKNRNILPDLETKGASNSLTRDLARTTQVQSSDLATIQNKLSATITKNDLRQLGALGEGHDTQDSEGMQKRKVIQELWRACERGDIQRVKRLIQKCQLQGISLNKGNKKDKAHTALHYAVKGEHFKLLEVLLDLGCDPNSTNGANHTALHMACMMQSRVMFTNLLSKGADPNIQDSNGNTALHYLAKHDSKELIIQFFKSSQQMINLNIVNSHDQRASDMAMRMDIKKFLSSEQAVRNSKLTGFTTQGHQRRVSKKTRSGVISQAKRRNVVVQNVNKDKANNLLKHIPKMQKKPINQKNMTQLRNPSDIPGIPNKLTKSQRYKQTLTGKVSKGRSQIKLSTNLSKNRRQISNITDDTITTSKESGLSAEKTYPSLQQTSTQGTLPDDSEESVPKIQISLCEYKKKKNQNQSARSLNKKPKTLSMQNQTKLRSNGSSQMGTITGLYSYRQEKNSFGSTFSSRQKRISSNSKNPVASTSINSRLSGSAQKTPKAIAKYGLNKYGSGKLSSNNSSRSMSKKTNVGRQMVSQKAQAMKKKSGFSSDREEKDYSYTIQQKRKQLHLVPEPKVPVYVNLETGTEDSESVGSSLERSLQKSKLLRPKNHLKRNIHGRNKGVNPSQSEQSSGNNTSEENSILFGVTKRKKSETPDLVKDPQRARKTKKNITKVNQYRSQRVSSKSSSKCNLRTKKNPMSYFKGLKNFNKHIQSAENSPVTSKRLGNQLANTKKANHTSKVSHSKLHSAQAPKYLTKDEDETPKNDETPLEDLQDENVESDNESMSNIVVEDIEQALDQEPEHEERIPEPIESTIRSSQQDEEDDQDMSEESPGPRLELVQQSESVGPEDFIAHKMLGTGSFGDVYLVEKVDGIQKNHLFAMKVLSKEKIMGNNLTRYALTERNVLSVIDHPFIVKLNYSFQTKNKLFLLLDYCPGGDLSEYLNVERRFNEYKARIYMAEILLALEHLHQNGIIYRDLKPDNVVLDNEGHALLTDFGLSKENMYEQNTSSFCGSYAYLAPEMIRRTGHGKSVDWYLLGVFLYEMLVGIPPYYDHDRDIMFENILNSTLELPNCSTEAQDILIKLLVKDPDERMGTSGGAQEIKDHPWFDDMDWDSVIKGELDPPMPYLKAGVAHRHTKLEEKQIGLPKQGEEVYDDEEKIGGWSFIHPKHFEVTL